ncbi:hypothetical protein CAPTEDRAFT_150697 [Capitella teleta]|uniref:ADP-ribosylation factor-like protein 3 n=1 Tax=Capitella teleta TaxID=283909 RepID=R7VDI2_CAPTE|nr:hypothetical protein CAPTEDRAFT_150697 [Capitella teleta]|eukprot:ELU13725.1 hypothetical protein CAPTEDRAFT_150697 [Capitella teleta]
MASSHWWANFEIYQKYAIVVGVGAIASFTAYLAYLQKQKMDASNRDEGFVDLAKDEEPTERKVLMLGLDGAGKSSLLQGLSSERGDNRQAPQATHGSNVLCLDKENPPLTIWEIGGAESMRKYWNNFVQDTCILLYVVDACDELRLPESYLELHKLLGDDRLKGVPIIIIANKQDIEGALSPLQAVHSMGLDNTSPNERKVLSIGTSAPPDAPFGGINDLKQLLIKLAS